MSYWINLFPVGIRALLSDSSLRIKHKRKVHMLPMQSHKWSYSCLYSLTQNSEIISQASSEPSATSFSIHVSSCYHRPFHACDSHLCIKITTILEVTERWKHETPTARGMGHTFSSVYLYMSVAGWSWLVPNSQITKHEYYIQKYSYQYLPYITNYKLYCHHSTTSLVLQAAFLTRPAL